MEIISRPQKPNLEYQYHQEGDVTVKSLTAESEQLWSNYLREDHFARAAIYRSIHADKEKVPTT
jgi:TfoX/Sxy family transcriptional regulator of competence genes